MKDTIEINKSTIVGVTAIVAIIIISMVIGAIMFGGNSRATTSTDVVPVVTQKTTVTASATPTVSPVKETLKFELEGEDLYKLHIGTKDTFVISAFAVAQGPYRTDNFIMQITTDEGKHVDLVFNEIARPTYTGKKLITLPAGDYFLQQEGGCSGHYTIDRA